MAKLVAPQGVRGVDVQTTRGVKKYNQNKQGLIEVNNSKDVAQLKKEGFFEASLMGPTTNSENIGFTCNACGFGSWFKKCGRCGNDNDRLEMDSSNG